MAMNPRLLRPLASGKNPETLDWISGVIAAGSSVNTATANAVDQFVSGCKSDGIWDSIKACCILCGPDTLAGALVPLVGTAPTNNNFVAGDYNRLTGLKGDGSTTYLDSNRANDADPQDDNHNAVWVSTAHNSGGGTGIYMDAGGTTVGANNFGESSTAGNLFSRNRTNTSNLTAAVLPTGLIGMSRSSSTEYILRADGANNTISEASDSPDSGDVFIFAREGSASSLANGRLAFYSIGESIDLAALDTRVSALITAIGNS